MIFGISASESISLHSFFDPKSASSWWSCLSEPFIKLFSSWHRHGALSEQLRPSVSLRLLRASHALGARSPVLKSAQHFPSCQPAKPRTQSSNLHRACPTPNFEISATKQPIHPTTTTTPVSPSEYTNSDTHTDILDSIIHTHDFHTTSSSASPFQPATIRAQKTSNRTVTNVLL